MSVKLSTFRLALLAVPLVIVIGLGAIFYQSLQTPSDPFASVLINKPAPIFALEPIAPEATEPVPPGLATDNLTGQVSLVNIFGSWCVACRIEHPLLMNIARNKTIPIMGVDWKDKPGDGAKWLNRFGNPYSRIGDDRAGRVAIDFGVTGAPETFVIDHQGVIRYKHVGPITEYDWYETLLPLIKKLQADANTPHNHIKSP